MKLFYILFFLILSLEAQFTLNVQSMHNNNIYILENKDIVFSGDSIKFTFQSSKNEKLEIYYDNNGSLEKIYSKKLIKKQQYNFPDENNWLVLNNDVGSETFVFKSDKYEKIFQLEHISVSSIINKGKIKSKKILAKSTFKQLDKRTYVNPADIKSNSRGKTEIRIFKQLSTPVVLIKVNEEIGTGVVISKEGNILTNWHVVKDKSNILVAFKPKIGNKPAKNNYYAAKVIKVNIENDLALIQLKNKNLTTNINPIKFSNIKNIEVGQDVYSIGHPLGELWTFSTGLVSQIRNEYRWTTNNIKHKSNYVIQTQNSISRGNSGGPLVNENVELLGINTLSKSAGQNLNYAISIQDITNFLSDITNIEPQNIDIKQNQHLIKFNIVKTKNGIDTKGNKISRAYVDSDNNGKIDISLIDIHRNGTWNLFYKDDNENNIYEEKKVDKNENGIIELIYKDKNEDGQWDLIGYDKDEDGYIDKWSNY